MMRWLFIVTGLLLLIAGCGESNKQIEEKIIPLRNFDHLVIDDIFTIEMVQDTTTRLVVRGQEKKLDDVLASIKDDTLTLSNRGALKWIRHIEPMQLTLYFRNLKHIVLNAPSDITNADTLELNRLKIICFAQMGNIDFNLDANHLYFVNSDTGGGTFRFSGRAGDVTFWQRGTSSVKAFRLKASKVKVKQNSLRACEVHALKQLHVTINRQSNVIYAGSPDKITRNITAGGQLIPAN